MEYRIAANEVARIAGEIDRTTQDLDRIIQERARSRQDYGEYANLISSNANEINAVAAELASDIQAAHELGWNWGKVRDVVKRGVSYVKTAVTKADNWMEKKKIYKALCKSTPWVAQIALVAEGALRIAGKSDLADRFEGVSDVANGVDGILKLAGKCDNGGVSCGNTAPGWTQTGVASGSLGEPISFEPVTNAIAQTNATLGDIRNIDSQILGNVGEIKNTNYAILGQVRDVAETSHAILNTNQAMLSELKVGNAWNEKQFNELQIHTQQLQRIYETTGALLAEEQVQTGLSREQLAELQSIHETSKQQLAVSGQILDEISSFRTQLLPITQAQLDNLMDINAKMTVTVEQLADLNKTASATYQSIEAIRRGQAVVGVANARLSAAVEAARARAEVAKARISFAQRDFELERMIAAAHGKLADLALQMDSAHQRMSTAQSKVFALAAEADRLEARWRMAQHIGEPDEEEKQAIRLAMQRRRYEDALWDARMAVWRAWQLVAYDALTTGVDLMSRQINSPQASDRLNVWLASSPEQLEYILKCVEQAASGRIPDSPGQNRIISIRNDVFHATSQQEFSGYLKALAGRTAFGQGGDPRRATISFATTLDNVDDMTYDHMVYLVGLYYETVDGTELRMGANLTQVGSSLRRTSGATTHLPDPRNRRDEYVECNLPDLSSDLVPQLLGGRGIPLRNSARGYCPNFAHRPYVTPRWDLILTVLDVRDWDRLADIKVVFEIQKRDLQRQ